jgi:hypothetical protein
MAVMMVPSASHSLSWLIACAQSGLKIGNDKAFKP